MKQWQQWLAVGAFAAAAIPAHAQAPAQESEAVPIYIGATYGVAQWSPGCPATASGCEDTDRALRVLAGYRFNNTWSAEVAYSNLGIIRFRDSTGADAAIKGRAWEAVAIAAFPITSALSLYGKLGGYRGGAKGSGPLTANKETNYGGTWGFGARADVTRNFGLRAEWQSYSSFPGGTLGPRSDVNVASFGATWQFR